MREAKTVVGQGGGRPAGRAAGGAGDLACAQFVERPGRSCARDQTPPGSAGQADAAQRSGEADASRSGGLSKLAETGIEPIAKVTPHSLRRTYASLRAALRDDRVYIAEQLGHQDARFTFRVYQRAAKRRERLGGEHLAAFDRACEWAAGSGGGDSRDVADHRETASNVRSQAGSGV